MLYIQHEGTSGLPLCSFFDLICLNNIFSFWLNFWVSPHYRDQPVLLLCAAVFPFLKSTVQSALSLHKIALIIVQMLMNEAISAVFTNCSPRPYPRRTVLVCFLSFPSPAPWHRNEDKECLWLDSLPSLHRHDAYFDEGKLILESKMFWWFYETGNPKLKTCLALSCYYRILITQTLLFFETLISLYV